MKRFLMVLYRDLKIHNIEEKRHKGVLELLTSGIAKLDPKKDDLGFGRRYQKLVDEMKVVISSWRGQYEPDADQIYSYLCQKQKFLDNLLKARKDALSR